MAFVLVTATGCAKFKPPVANKSTTAVANTETTPANADEDLPADVEGIEFVTTGQGVEIHATVSEELGQKMQQSSPDDKVSVVLDI